MRPPLLIALTATALALSLLAPGALPKKPPTHRACPGGRYLVVGEPLIAGDTAGPREPIVLDGDSQISIGNCCDRAPARLTATKKGTKVRVTWPACIGASRVHLRATIDPTCHVMGGMLKARKLRPKHFMAMLATEAQDTTTCPGSTCANPRLGSAGDCTVLELGGATVQLTGPPGGILGDVCVGPQGRLAISGSQYVSGNVRLAAGATFKKSGSTTVGNVLPGQDLSAEISAAQTAASDAAALACTKTFTSLTGNQTIVGNGGTNVICVTDVILQAGQVLTLQGGSGDTFVFNVTGKFIVNGGQIVASGIQPRDVLYNILGIGAPVTLTGGPGGTTCCSARVDGTVLAPARSVSLSPGLVNGEVVSGQRIGIVGGASVRCPPPPPCPSTTTTTSTSTTTKTSSTTTTRPSITTTTTTSSTTTSTMVLPPTISDFNPKSAHIGDTVTITGANFAPPSGAGPQVTMNRQGGGTMAAPVASFTATTIVIVVPAGAASGPLTVTVVGQSVTSAATLTILPASDFTLSVSPGSADLIQGQSVTYAVSLSSTNGFSQLASLSVSGLPAGLSGSFNRPFLTAGQTALLTLTAPASQPVGMGTFTVMASATVQGIPEARSVNAGVNVQRLTMSFLGRTVVQDPTETPLAGVTITFLGVDFQGKPTGCSGQTVSDAAGNFMITNLPSACENTQLIRFDGTTVTSPPGTYAGVDLLYTFIPGQVTTPPVLIHLPRVDDAETVMVKQNAAFDQIFTFRSIPGLSVTVYAGTTFTLANGTQPNPFPFTAVQVPVDRLPDVMPQTSSTVMAFIVAFQPANTTASQPVAVTFPNTLNTAPGTNMVLNTLDPTKGVMVQYGTGTVSNDGTQIVPDPDPNHPGHRYGLVHFDWHGPSAPAPNQTNPSPDSYPTPTGSYCAFPAAPQTIHPVDLSSGIEVITASDIAINGSRGAISIVRTYRTLSTNPGPFGIGTAHNYSFQLNVQNQGQGVITLILPDGNQFPFSLQLSPGAGGAGVNSTIPSLLGAVLTAPATGIYRLRWKNGTTYEFQTLGRITVLTSITDSNGNAISVVRNPSQPLQIAQVIDPVGRNLSLTYDSANRIVSIVDPIGRTVTYTYNAQGTLATVTDPAGGVTTYGYDAQNHLTQVTDPRGVVVVQNEYDTSGRVVRQTQADGGVITLAYTLLNPMSPATSPVLLTTVTDPLGNQTTYHFSPLGFLLDVTDALGQIRVFTRDPATKLLLSITGTASCGACGTGPGDVFFTYDTNGNVLSRTDALGNTTTFTYEPTFNKVASLTDPVGKTSTFQYDPSNANLKAVTDPSGAKTTFAYDPTGLLTSVTDALGNVGTFDHDGAGNLTSITDPLGNVSTLAYDAVSRITNATDPRGRSTQITYDSLDRIKTLVDAANGTTRFSYDLNGNLLSLTDALGHQTAYAYDQSNRLLQRTDPLMQTETFGYDANSNLTQDTDRKGQVSMFTRDVLNRLTTAIYPDATMTLTYDAHGRLAQVSDSAGGVIQRKYDVANELLEEVGPSGVVDYSYDPAGRRTTITVGGQPPVQYGYDAKSRVTSITQANRAVSYQYDALGRRTLLMLPNGVSTEYDYDVASRLTQLTYRNSNGILGNLTYDYDAAGNRTHVGGSFARTILPDPIAAGSAVYDANNRQTQFGGQVMSFDRNGNLTSIADSTGTTNLTWDARNRLIAFTSPTATASFAYDALGRRLRKTFNGEATQFLDDGFNLVETIGVGAPANILQGAGIDEPLLRGGNEYYMADPLGSVVVLTDSTGTIQDQYIYGPYGQTEVATGSSPNPFRFTGRETDGTGLYYYRARYYDPALQRFTAEDPLEFAGADADVLGLSVNRYEYALDNPVSNSDPTGKQVLQIILRVIGKLAPGRIGPSLTQPVVPLACDSFILNNRMKYYEAQLELAKGGCGAARLKELKDFITFFENVRDTCTGVSTELAHPPPGLELP